MTLSRRHLNPVVISIGLTLPLCAQVTQHRGESYDEYYTRKVRDETANFRNNNPTFNGTRPSANADWSSWDGIIARYNQRHGAAAPVSPAEDPAEQSRRARRIEEQQASAAIDRRMIEADNAAVRAYNEVHAAAAAGDRTATLRLAERFEYNNLAPGLLYPRETRLNRAFWLYHRAMEGPTPQIRLQFFGTFPALLAPAEFKYTAGEWIQILRRYESSASALEVLTKADAAGDVVASLVLGAWYQLSFIGFAMYDGPLGAGPRLVESRRLYEKVAGRFPALGRYFLGTLDESDASQRLLFALAEAPPPLPGDKDGLLTGMIRAHTRIHLAERILKGNIPGGTAATAAALLQDCAPAENAANAILGNRVFAASVFDPISVALNALESSAVQLPLRTGAAAFEKIPQFSGGPNPNGWYRGRGLLLRGIAELTGEQADGSLGKPDPAAALRSFAAAREQFENGQCLAPVFGEKEDLNEARTRELALDYLRGTGPGAATVVDRLSRLNNKVAAARAGILCARGGPGFPAAPGRALAFFSRALVIFKKRALMDMSAIPGGSLRTIDVAEIADALADLLRAHPEAGADAVSVIRKCLPLTQGQSRPETYAFFAEYRLRGRPVHDDYWEDNYKTAIVLLRQAADASPAFAGLRAEAAIRRALDLGDIIERRVPDRLKALGDDPAARPWQEAFAQSGDARVAALAKIPGETARLLTRALIAYERVCEGRTFAEAFRALGELADLTAAGSLDACHLLKRCDGAWRRGLATGNATRWLNAVVPPLRARATAKMLEGVTAPEAPFYLETARNGWFAARDLGVPEAVPALQRILPILGNSPSAGPADLPARQQRITNRAEVMAFLVGLPDEFWTKATSVQLNLACAAMEKAGQTALIPRYLAAESELVGARDDTTQAGLLFHTARCALKGWGVPADRAQAARLLEDVNHSDLDRNGLDLKAWQELQELQAKTPRQNSNHTQSQSFREALKAAQSFPASLGTQPAGIQAELFAWATGPEAQAEAKAPNSAASALQLRESTALLAAFLPLGHPGAFQEMERRAKAGEPDSSCLLAVTLLGLSYANAPVVSTHLRAIDRSIAENFIKAVYDTVPGFRTALEALARNHFGFTEMNAVLAKAAGKHLSATQPFLIDPPKGDLWTIRLAREHLAAEPADAPHFFRALLNERFAKIEEKHFDEVTPLEAFRQLELSERFNPLSAVYMKLLREHGDPVSFALVLDREVPDGDDAKTGWGYVVEIAGRLAAVAPAPNDALLAYCRSIGHQALRRIAAQHPPAFALLEAEANAGHASAKAELGLFLATRSSANAPRFVPLLEKARTAGWLDPELSDKVTGILLRWQENAPGRPRALLSFLTRFAAGETGGAPYLTSGDDYAGFNPTFHGDKPVRDSEVIRLLQKAAAAGDAEAKALLAEK